MIYGDTVIEGNVVPEGASPAPPSDLPSPQALRSKRALLLNVRVPENAKVFVNGVATSSVGSERQYMTQNLTPGRVYTYEVKVESMLNGEKVVDTKKVDLAVGDARTVDFDMAQVASSEPQKTTLVVNLPADAKLILAGNKTNTTGTVREFSTTKLAAGQTWKYPVRIEFEQNGETKVFEEMVSLQAGDTRELHFSADATKVARAN